MSTLPSVNSSEVRADVYVAWRDVWLGAYFDHLLPAPAVMLKAVNFVISFCVITFLFGMIFKLPPDPPSAASQALTASETSSRTRCRPLA